MTLIRKDLDFEEESCLCDPVGRFIILNATVQGVKYVFANFYAPNKVRDQCIYFKELQDRLDGIISSPEQKVVIGGDFNVTFDSNLDCSGGSPAQKESVKVLEEICLDMDLVDVWRIRNPDIRSFTWKQTKPLIQRRLDFWLISDICQDEVEQVKIIPSIKSDHSAITLLFNGIEEQRHGPSHWKFNSNLTKDGEYIKLITDSVPVWIEEFKDVNDKRVLWDLIKYRIRQVSMRYSKEKARLRRVKILEIETSLTFYQEKCSADPSTENFEQFEILKSKYDVHFDYLSKGAIIRSRASWYEKGEKNTKYFLSLESHKKAKSCVRKVFTKNGTLSSDPKIIMNELEDFYTGLYDSEDNLPDYANLFLRHSEIPKLSPEKASTCEGKLTVEECLQSLQSFKENKSPGNDGLTVEFYKTFWGILGELLVESLNCAFDHGELSNSQKQAIITLIEKKGKDRRQISNWRPISLINLDTKIGSKAIARRLQEVIPDIIHYNQNAYVKGKSIFDTVRAIDDILEFTEREKIQRLMVAIDFKKAFDSVNRNFMLETLSAFNFGPTFIRWIRTFYQNITSSVMNNGFSTGPFNIRRGVRQGDPLSPYLFIICLETLAINVRGNKNIQGILVGKEEIKLEMFADDVTAFLRNTRSFEALLHTADLFSKCSGLEINPEKTECMVLGNHVSSTVATVSKNICMKDTIKILGVYFTYNDSQRKKLNFDEILRSIREKLQMWKWRDLTILGRIQIVKTFAIPIFMYRASLICVQKDIVIEVNKLLFNFIWKGKDKVKRLSLICDLDKGGLKAPHLESIIKSQRIMCCKKFAENQQSNWKIILSHYMKNVGSKLILRCAFDLKKLCIQLPQYYEECFRCFAEYSVANKLTEQVLCQEIHKKVIWNNTCKFICIQGKSVFCEALFNKRKTTLLKILRLKKMVLSQALKLLQVHYLHQKKSFSLWRL